MDNITANTEIKMLPQEAQELNRKGVVLLRLSEKDRDKTKARRYLVIGKWNSQKHQDYQSSRGQTVRIGWKSNLK